MKVKELKALLAKMDDEEEISADVPIGIMTSLNELKKSRLHMTISFPEEGIPLTDLLEEDELQDLLKDTTPDGNISESIIECLREWDRLYDIEDAHIHYEIRS